MRKSAAVLLLVIFIVSPVFADGPEEEEVRPTPSRREMINDIVNKPQRKLSTVGPVPVGTVPQAPVLPGSGNGLNAKELNVLVAPQGFGRPVRPRGDEGQIQQGQPERPMNSQN